MIIAVIGTIPLGLGIALNPLAIVSSILILRKPDARTNGLSFVAGWVIGLLLLVILPALLVQDQIGKNLALAQDLPALIWIVSGILLIATAAWSLRNRPDASEQPAPPRWTRLIDDGSLFRMLGLGLLLSMMSLRNLVLMAAAAGVIGQARLPLQELLIAAAAFVTISTLGILIPLLIYLVGGADANARLALWGDWLVRQAPVITAVVMIALGLLLLGRGLEGLF